MIFTLNIHRIKSIEPVKKIGASGGHWIDLVLTDENGKQQEITVFGPDGTFPKIILSSLEAS